MIKSVASKNGETQSFSGNDIADKTEADKTHIIGRERDKSGGEEKNVKICKKTIDI